MVRRTAVALVTGAASGIGAACAARLAEELSVVVVTDMDVDALAETAAAVESAGARALALPMDVTREEAVEAAVGVAQDAGVLAVAVNAAGIGGPSLPVAEYPLDAWRAVLDVDLTGVFLCMRAELQAMLSAGSGSIINISSVMAEAAAPLAPAYTAAKHAVEGLTQSAALAHAAAGVRVNSVAPGFIDTPLLRGRAGGEQIAALAARHPVARLGTPADVAEVVAFLASERSAFVTGSCYRVDGGYLTKD